MPATKPKAPPAPAPKTEKKKSNVKQYEVVQLWDQRNFDFRDPADLDADERAAQRWRPIISFIQCKIVKGYDAHGFPMYKSYYMPFDQDWNVGWRPKKFSGTRDNPIVEAPGVLLSSFRIPVKVEKVIEALQEHAVCWVPNSSDPVKADKMGKAFYVREVSDESESIEAIERASGRTDKAPTIEDSWENDPAHLPEGELVYEDEEELVEA